MQGARSLEHVGLLQGLGDADRTRLQAECRWRTIARGAEVISAEAGSTEVHFIASGRVRVTFYSPSGREVAFRELGAGTSFGELSAIDGQTRSASVVALDETTIATLSRDRFWRLLRESPEVSANVLRNLAALVRDLSARIVDTTVLTVPQRVRAEIVRLARATGPKGKSALILRSPTHAELASQIGATREAVSRELSRMAGEGLVERRGRDLLVHDVAGLHASIETLRDS
jgi:CRP/FNR family cyclic AMP-dependent transcriptional regulator